MVSDCISAPYCNTTKRAAPAPLTRTSQTRTIMQWVGGLLLSPELSAKPPSSPCPSHSFCSSLSLLLQPLLIVMGGGCAERVLQG